MSLLVDKLTGVCDPNFVAGMRKNAVRESTNSLNGGYLHFKLRLAFQELGHLIVHFKPIVHCKQTNFQIVFWLIQCKPQCRLAWMVPHIFINKIYDVICNIFGVDFDMYLHGQISFQCFGQ